MPKTITEDEKAQAPGRTDRMPSHLCLAHYGPGLIGYQTGARIVRQAQEQTEPEYIRSCTVSSKLAVTPVASKSTYDVRWSIPDMGIETQITTPIKTGSTTQRPFLRSVRTSPTALS